MSQKLIRSATTRVFSCRFPSEPEQTLSLAPLAPFAAFKCRDRHSSDERQTLYVNSACTMSLSQRARRVYELPEELLRLIEATLLECSRTNIKACRSFLLRSFLNSSLKVDRLGKFLTALSRQITPADHGAIENLPRETLFTARRKRLHILYLLNDVLFHASHHPRKSRWQSFSKGLSPHLVELVYLASAAASNAEDDTMKRVKGIIEIWAEQGYLSKDYVDNKLRTTAEYAGKLNCTFVF